MFEAIADCEPWEPSARTAQSAIERRRALAAAMQLELALYFAEDDHARGSTVAAIVGICVHDPIAAIHYGAAAGRA